MPAPRSPNYPAVDLATALAELRPAFDAENRNKMSRMVLAKHLGYSSLNGRALAKIGAVRAYGLIEGSNDELKVAEDAITAYMAPAGDPKRSQAIAKLAARPSIFREISAEYATLPSEDNLRFFLTRKGYTQEAAGKAAQHYLATMRLAAESGAAHTAGSLDQTVQPITVEAVGNTARFAPPPPLKPPLGIRQAVFTLAEGDVTLGFPSDLSTESFDELSDYLTIFLKSAKRKAGAEKAAARAKAIADGDGPLDE